ncbi:transposase [Burkholderia pseudomallei BPC006]|nr:transposase [Burkholderia pseudomallei BPC006]
MFFNGVMLKTPMPTQHELEMVTLEELVPKDHLLRQIDAAVDFEFIRAKVAHLYCADNGRPALDPVVMFKLLFIGYLFGVRSERQLMREVQVNVAYRWFARFRLTDKVPDASTFSQNRAEPSRTRRCIRRSSTRSCGRRSSAGWSTVGCCTRTART